MCAKKTVAPSPSAVKDQKATLTIKKKRAPSNEAKVMADLRKAVVQAVKLAHDMGKTGAVTAMLKSNKKASAKSTKKPAQKSATKKAVSRKPKASADA